MALGISTLALMLWEPHLEGRNVNATLFEIYFRDPFLAYAYTASIVFFVALLKHISCWAMPEKIKYSRKRPYMLYGPYNIA